MIFETHAHYDDEAFDGDRDSLIWAMHEHGIDTIINVGASLRGVRETVTLMERYPFVYGAIGVHPDEVGDLDEEKIAWMRKLCEKEKTVAVGEIGLDYYWDKESHEIQKKWFVRQMDLAKEMSLPIIVHSRNAAKDTMDLMKAEIWMKKKSHGCVSFVKKKRQLPSVKSAWITTGIKRAMKFRRNGLCVRWI